MLALVLATTGADASPAVPLDEWGCASLGNIAEWRCTSSVEEPVYDELAELRAEDRLPPYQGGLAPLTTARVRGLLAQAGLATPPAPRGWWIDPIARAALSIVAAHEDDRPYSTPVHPRDVVGFIGVTCEHQEGRPCGNGVETFGELDSSAGYGDWVSGSVRLRPHVGDDVAGNGLDFDRGYVNVALGPVALEAGRDIVVLGPRSRTQLGWGDNAPPLDQIRVSTSHPLAIAPGVSASLDYVLGRLRDPQTYPGDLVSIARGQLDLGDRVELGMMQLLQTEGEGAPHLDAWQFIREQVTRGDASAGPTDSSNRRVGFDVATRIAGFHGARLYYQVMFEDWRKEFDDAIRYDADHLVGIEVPAFHDLVVEWQKTGVRSQEHFPRVTGFTQGGRVVGSPLGPDAQSLYACMRLPMEYLALSPWAEIARFSSDTYTFVTDGPIQHDTDGIAELRYRLGARLVIPIRDRLRLESSAVVEHVEDAAFIAGARRDNVGVSATLVWHP